MSAFPYFLQETWSRTLSCAWSRNPTGAADQRFPLLVACYFVWLLVTNYRFSLSYYPTVKPVIKSLYVQPLNKELMYHSICFFHWVLRLHTFLVKITLKEIFKIILKNAFVPDAENLAKESKIPHFFRNPPVGVSAGTVTGTHLALEVA